MAMSPNMRRAQARRRRAERARQTDRARPRLPRCAASGTSSARKGEGRYHFVERSYGSFSRAFTLPQGVDESQIRADFEHGELIIHVPKPALPQPRKVQISAASVGGSGSAAASRGAGGQGTTAEGASAPSTETPGDGSALNDQR
ncbi:hypothetical protein tb265_30960 [Gemmatimonadetes bacterium T265]|nr:hypothetical protein tb265_30960 [Gemmatimonadetes bacterium T265]